MWHKLLVIMNITFMAGHALCMQQQKSPRKSVSSQHIIDEKVGIYSEKLQKLKQELHETLGLCFSRTMADLQKEGHGFEEIKGKNPEDFFSIVVDWSTEKEISKHLAEFNKHSAQLNEWEKEFSRFAIDLLEEYNGTKNCLLDAEIKNSLLHNIARLREQLFKDMAMLICYQEIRYASQMERIKQTAQTVVEKNSKP